MIVSRSAGMRRTFGQEFPAPVDRLALEVIAEAEIPQHLEERFVKRGAADIFDVAGADAFLAGGRPREARIAEAEEFALELIHPGGSEQHGRVVGHEHVARPANASLGFEEFEERFAEFVYFHLIVTCPRSVSSMTGPSRDATASANSWGVRTSFPATRSNELAAFESCVRGRRAFFDFDDDNAMRCGLAEARD